ncbi:BamA/TamA family outer membrane protein [Variovorax sp. J22P168]|uniref:BamA/TamA family outer membrane protein n=1 Tax=Variovorax jilinensis TaxID=3053513 RepID=UPI002577B064|nr:BamA/TamA family outer membrane protein [Variovorax sp. J22P168]MDM0015375.1 BamA/TamA family outer membrane protein [Variovorax sp. J22P168]
MSGCWPEAQQGGALNRPRPFTSLALLLCFAFVAGTSALAQDGGAEGQAAPEARPRIRSADDGWLDISEFLDQSYGFVPLAIPITEPTIGLGAVGALTFIDKPREDAAAGFGRPNVTVVGALGTDNGTKGAFAGDMRHWLDDRVKTLAGVMRASVNLDFYGIGHDAALQDHPRSYNLKTTALVLQGRYRIAESPVWVGLGYALASTSVSFNGLEEPQVQPAFQRDSRVGGLLPTLSFDSRDNMFTPNRGSYLELSAGLFSEALGGDSAFQRVNLAAIHYHPLARDLTLGVMGSSVLSFGDVPFYLRPFISLRGVPVMRYQGDFAAQVEAELRWQFWERFSLVGFAGAGGTRNQDRSNRASQNVTTGGFGLRYEIARKYGLHMGLDVAYGPTGPVYYVQFGSAWMRP